MAASPSPVAGPVPQTVYRSTPTFNIKIQPKVRPQQRIVMAGPYPGTETAYIVQADASLRREAPKDNMRIAKRARNNARKVMRRLGIPH